jgi:MinD-like ATPase involved in chromosome partitioning or flagellar assembly
MAAGMTNCRVELKVKLQKKKVIALDAVIEMSESSLLFPMQLTAAPANAAAR